MVHVPLTTSVTTAPDTLQMEAEVEVNVTGSPEDAVAVRVTGPAPND
jgi:hypothetical protein